MWARRPWYMLLLLLLVLGPPSLVAAQENGSWARRLWSVYGFGRKDRAADRPAITSADLPRPATGSSETAKSATGSSETAKSATRVALARATPAARDLPGPRRTVGTARNQPASRSQAELLESAKVVATVGDQVILAGDLLGHINQLLQPHVGQVPEATLEAKRWELMEQMLPQVVDAKLLYVDFLRTIPDEKVPEVLDNIYRQFDDIQLPKMVEKAQVQTAAELDALLRTFGSSLDSQRRTFAERLLAQEWQRRSVSEVHEVSHAEMLEYYETHRRDYEISAKARWEQLMTRKTEFPTKEAAELALGEMGNEVLYGANFAAVAKRKSQGPTAALGGQYDWTSTGESRLHQTRCRDLLTAPW